ncbi:hypothetical protein [Mycobacteroides sp. LB1]|uniref:hypothetical protein n=1 Tax=Mycobacteroides sp. LB1 TaxID=2750814 RepID=UPI0015DED309|nr:hypothetical protein [Mycobacteroides sp. LB1]
MTKWRTAALFVMGLTLTACTHGGIQHTETSTSSAPNRLDSLPLCSSIKPQAIEPDPDPALQCVLRSKDSAKLTLEVMGTPPTTIKVYEPNGTERQTFTVPVNKPERTPPLLADLDQDGRDELVVVDNVGSDGDVLDVWRVNKDSGNFSRAGQVFGYPEFRITDERFTAFYASTGAGSGRVSLYRFVNDKVVELGSLFVQAADWPDPADPARTWHTNGNTLCSFNYDDDPPGQAQKRNQALTEAGIDPPSAQDRFCKQSWVADIYKKR